MKSDSLIEVSFKETIKNSIPKFNSIIYQNLPSYAQEFKHFLWIFSYSIIKLSFYYKIWKQ